MSEPTYNFYKSVGGTLDADTFNAWLPKATAHVDWLIGWKAVPAQYETAYEKAVCFALDELHEYGTTASGGFTIGSFRMSDEGGRISGKDAATDAAWEVLAPTGLLWAGVI